MRAFQYLLIFLITAISNRQVKEIEAMEKSNVESEYN
jgi:hypothetical protein